MVNKDNINNHKQAIVEPIALHQTTNKMSIVLHYYCLKELGIDEKLVEQALLRHKL